MQTDKVSKWVQANLHLGAQIFHTVANEQYPQLQNGGCGPPEISSAKPMVICERQGLPSDLFSFCLPAAVLAGGA